STTVVAGRRVFGTNDIDRAAHVSGNVYVTQTATKGSGKFDGRIHAVQDGRFDRGVAVDWMDRLVRPELINLAAYPWRIRRRSVAVIDRPHNDRKGMHLILLHIGHVHGPGGGGFDMRG